MDVVVKNTFLDVPGHNFLFFDEPCCPERRRKSVPRAWKPVMPSAHKQRTLSRSSISSTSSDISFSSTQGDLSRPSLREDTVEAADAAETTEAAVAADASEAAEAAGRIDSERRDWYDMSQHLAHQGDQGFRGGFFSTSSVDEDMNDLAVSVWASNSGAEVLHYPYGPTKDFPTMLPTSANASLPKPKVREDMKDHGQSSTPQSNRTSDGSPQKMRESWADITDEMDGEGIYTLPEDMPTSAGQRAAPEEDRKSQRNAGRKQRGRDSTARPGSNHQHNLEERRPLAYVLTASAAALAKAAAAAATASAAETAAAKAWWPMQSPMMPMSPMHKASPGCEAKTTLMFRNIPNNTTRRMFLDIMNEKGFAGQYDFFYMPIDHERGVGKGYAFVNCVDPAQAVHMKKSFQGFKAWSGNSKKTCDVCWAEPHQGLEKNIEYWRNNSVMHRGIPDEYKPMLFENGEHKAFPAPTKRLRYPKKDASAASRPRKE